MHLEKVSKDLDAVGAGLYAFFNRLLIPFGLHHALNNVFWFDTIGLGDLSHFWAGETSADVTWSLGMYMSGFFPCMMFGILVLRLLWYIQQNLQEESSCYRSCCFSSNRSICLRCYRAIRVRFHVPCTVLYVIYALLYGIFRNNYNIGWIPCRIQFLSRCDRLVLSIPSGCSENMADHSAWYCSIRSILCSIPFRNREIRPEDTWS